MTAMPTPASTWLNDLARRGIELQAHGDRLRFRPRSVMTPDLAERVKARKPALLTILAATASLPTLPVPAAGSPQDEWNARQRPEPWQDAPGWPTIPDGTPPAVAGLARAGTGWTAWSWRDRLLQLAVACQAVNPARAGELWEAAKLLKDQADHAGANGAMPNVVYTQRGV